MGPGKEQKGWLDHIFSEQTGLLRLQQNEMIFAAHMLARRKGKKIFFKSRGREHSGADVEHYWRRKKEKPTDFSPILNTPDELEYWTPTPTPGETVTNMASPQNVLISDDIEVESLRQHHPPSSTDSSRVVEIFDDAEDTAASSADDAMPIDIDLDSLQEYGFLATRSPSPSAIAGRFLRKAYQSKIERYQSMTLRSLDFPETLRHQQHILNCGSEYFQWWIETIHRSRRMDWGRSNQAIEKFRDGGLALISAIEQRYSEDHVEIMHLDLIEMLPSVLHQENPHTIITIMHLLQRAARHGAQISAHFVRFRDKALDQALRLWGKDHPSTLLLKNICHPRASLIDLIWAFLPAKDLLTKNLGYQHNLVGNLLALLCDIAMARGDYTESLQYATEMQQVDIARYQESWADHDLLSSFLARWRVIFAHTKCGSYDEANKMIEDGFEQLLGFHDEDVRNQSRAVVLDSLGYVAFLTRQFTVALDAFREALSIYLRFYGASDCRTSAVAGWVRHLQGLMDHELPI